MTIDEIREQLFGEYADQDCLALPHPQWCQRGLILAQEHRIAQFKVADWIVEGIELVGATSAYDFAEAVFPQYARVTFQSWVTVAKHFTALFRIESNWLTFGHYQVAQGAEKDSAEGKELQVAREMVWLRQADERRMSVSALRDAIANAYFLLHPDLTKVPVDDPDPEPEPKKAVKKNIFGNPIKEFQTPWLPERTRWALDELSRARHMTTEQLLARVVQDFIDAHTDEIGDAKAAVAKREEERAAAMCAAEVVETEMRVREGAAVKRIAAERKQKRCEFFLADALFREVQARQNAAVEGLEGLQAGSLSDAEILETLSSEQEEAVTV
jgi:hypothetical protein